MSISVNPDYGAGGDWFHDRRMSRAYLDWRRGSESRAALEGYPLIGEGSLGRRSDRPYLFNDCCMLASLPSVVLSGMAAILSRMRRYKFMTCNQ
jgi:hypothetical protein